MLAASIILPGVALAGPAVESSISKLDFGSLYRKLRYRGDDGVLFWWLSGTKYAHFENEVTHQHDNYWLSRHLARAHFLHCAQDGSPT